MNIFNPFKRNLPHSALTLTYEEIMTRPYRWRHSGFWDSVIIDFDCGDIISIACKSEHNICKYYLKEKDAWIYMSGERGEHFIDGVKSFMNDEFMKELL